MDASDLFWYRDTTEGYSDRTVTKTDIIRYFII